LKLTFYILWHWRGCFLFSQHSYLWCCSILQDLARPTNAKLELELQNRYLTCGPKWWLSTYSMKCTILFVAHSLRSYSAIQNSSNFCF